MKVGLEMDTNETLIRRIRSSKVDKDEYTDIMENVIRTRWYIKCIGMCIGMYFKLELGLPLVARLQQAMWTQPLQRLSSLYHHSNGGIILTAVHTTSDVSCETENGLSFQYNVEI